MSLEMKTVIGNANSGAAAALAQESTYLPVGSEEKILLGLPCARCRIYYVASLDACPVCGHQHRLIV